MEARNNLANQLKESQSKYAYHIMALNAAAIAYGVNTSIGLNITNQILPLGIAVFLWLLSLYAGLKYLQFSQTHDYLNIQLIDMETGQHQLTGRYPEKIQIGTTSINDFMKTASRKTSFYGKMQDWCLYLGTISFIIWRVFVMLPYNFERYTRSNNFGQTKWD